MRVAILEEPKAESVAFGAPRVETFWVEGLGLRESPEIPRTEEAIPRLMSMEAVRTATRTWHRRGRNEP